MMHMEFQGTVTLGEVLQIVSFLIAVFAAYNRITNQITKIETTIKPIYDWWRANVNERPMHNRHSSLGD